MKGSTYLVSLINFVRRLFKETRNPFAKSRFKDSLEDYVDDINIYNV